MSDSAGGVVDQSGEKLNKRSGAFESKPLELSLSCLCGPAALIAWFSSRVPEPEIFVNKLPYEFLHMDVQHIFGPPSEAVPSTIGILTL